MRDKEAAASLKKKLGRYRKSKERAEALKKKRFGHKRHKQRLKEAHKRRTKKMVIVMRITPGDGIPPYTENEKKELEGLLPSPFRVFLCVFFPKKFPRGNLHKTRGARFMLGGFAPAQNRALAASAKTR